MKIEDISRIAVLGAGTMGHGIAQVSAAAGYSVALYDISDEAVQAGLTRIEKNLAKGVDRGKVDPDTVPGIIRRLSSHHQLESAIDGAQVIIEAVPERLELKQQIFGMLGEKASDEAILATNTSSFSIDSIGDAAGAPDRVVGLHFFNPVHIMKLLEVVVGERTAPEVEAVAMALAEKLGKTAIRVKDSPGFATSRLGIALAMEAIRMVEEGVASPNDIDTAMELGYRHPMGPLRLTDLVGLDVRLDITRYLHDKLGTDTFEPPRLLEEMVEDGRLGKKVGRGFYDYD